MLDRGERQSSKGDVTITLSQCVGCENNLNITDCKVYGKKPSTYAIAGSGSEKCPERVEIQGV